MNFFRIFDIGEPFSIDTLKDDIGNYNFIMHSFIRVEADVIANFRDLIVSAFDGLDSKAKRRMQGAINEALLNAFNHAFSREADFKTQGKRAWLCGYVNPEKSEVAFMIFDQGAGIPRTLTPTKMERLMSAIPKLDLTSDGSKIDAATQLGRTATMQDGRGKGFKSMKAFVEACEDADLQVFSNHGRYKFDKSGSQVFDDAEISLGGTLVMMRARHTTSEFNINV